MLISICPAENTFEGPFEIEQLNVGGTINIRSGYFTAPVNGIYHFEFSSLKDYGYSGQTAVNLKVNGNIAGASYVYLDNGHFTLFQYKCLKSFESWGQSLLGEIRWCCSCRWLSSCYLLYWMAR